MVVLLRPCKLQGTVLWKNNLLIILKRRLKTDQNDLTLLITTLSKVSTAATVVITSEPHDMHIHCLPWQWFLNLSDTNVAPSLQAARDSLIKEQLADRLEKKIEARPSKEELVEHNIIKGYWQSRTAVFVAVIVVTPWFEIDCIFMANICSEQTLLLLLLFKLYVKV